MKIYLSVRCRLFKRSFVELFKQNSLNQYYIFGNILFLEQQLLGFEFVLSQIKTYIHDRLKRTYICILIYFVQYFDSRGKLASYFYLSKTRKRT